MNRVERLEKYLRDKVTLNFSRPPDDKMEVVDKTRTPTTFVEFFFEMCDGNFPDDPRGYSEPPTQGMFANAFYSHHNSQGSERFTPEYKECWIRRCEVTYPSLLRDMHFSYLIQDYNDRESTFDRVTYNPEKDVRDGADAIVEKDDELYYVNLYVDTEKSRAFLDEKKDHRHPEHNHTEVHLPMSRYDSRNKRLEIADRSDIWLYTEEYIREIVEAVS